MNNSTAQTTTFAQKAIALLMALVLCMGLTPHAAWADDAAAGTGEEAGQATEQPTVTLTIVKGANEYGVNALVNKSYAFTDGDTLSDLFAKAKAAGTIADYAFNEQGFLASVTLADGTVLARPSDYSSYWGGYKNGAYDDGTGCAKGSKLSAGDALQFAWLDMSPNAAPTADQWAELKAKAEGVDPAPTPEPTPKPTDPTAALNKYDAAKAQTLTGNLSARFAADGADAAIDNNKFYAAVALNSLGKGGSVDAAAILANLNKDDAMTAGRLGKYIMALAAAGVDCTNVDDNGTARNLVAEMEALEATAAPSVYDAVCILPVYAYGSYEQGESALSMSDLIDTILANVDSEGLFGSVAYGCDTQTTAQAILALPYQQVRSDVAAAIEKAQAALLSHQNADGSFAYNGQYAGANLDATANIVAALEALGIDCTAGQQVTTANGSTPLGYLTSVADENLAGYLDASSYNEAAASATVLLALAAHEGAQQAGGAYSVFTLKSPETPGPAPIPADPTPGKADNNGNLAKTSDSASAAAAAFAALALCALASGAVAARRARRAETIARR